MKKVILFLIILVSPIVGCGKYVVSGGPYVDVNSGSEYAAVLVPKDGVMDVWIRRVDGDIAARNIFGGGVYGYEGDVFIKPGIRKFEVECKIHNEKRYNIRTIAFEAEAGEEYTLTCSLAGRSTAKYQLVDRSGNVVSFD